MLRDKALWRFEANPEPEWRYLRSRTREILNCVYEEISLKENEKLVRFEPLTEGLLTPRKLDSLSPI